MKKIRMLCGHQIRDQASKRWHWKSCPTAEGSIRPTADQGGEREVPTQRDWVLVVLRVALRQVFLGVNKLLPFPHQLTVLSRRANCSREGREFTVLCFIRITVSSLDGGGGIQPDEKKEELSGAGWVIGSQVAYIHMHGGWGCEGGLDSPLLQPAYGHVSKHFQAESCI